MADERDDVHAMVEPVAGPAPLAGRAARRPPGRPSGRPRLRHRRLPHPGRAGLGRRRGGRGGRQPGGAAPHRRRAGPAVATGAARVLLVQADLKDPLPFPDAAFDRVVCHNVLECLHDPEALAAEARPGAPPRRPPGARPQRLRHLIFASEDLDLTRRLVRAYCDAQQPWMDAVDGTIGRRLAAIAGRAGLDVQDV